MERLLAALYLGEVEGSSVRSSELLSTRTFPKVSQPGCSSGKFPLRSRQKTIFLEYILCLFSCMPSLISKQLPALPGPEHTAAKR